MKISLVALWFALYAFRLSFAENAPAFDTVVFCCSESLNVPITVMFKGEELGRVYVVSNAGNVVSIAGLQPDSVQIASVQYAVERGAKRVIVLGHKGCDVVQSVIDNPTGKGHLPAIYQVISVAVTSAKKIGGNDLKILLQGSIENNVMNSVDRLRDDRFALYKLVRDGKLEIVGAYYDPETNSVEYMK